MITETYRNGYSWYRKYSDGFTEQGGRTVPSVRGTQSYVKKFSNVVLGVQLTMRNSYGGEKYTSMVVNDPTLSSFDYFWGAHWNSGNNQYLFWYAYGY